MTSTLGGTLHFLVAPLALEPTFGSGVAVLHFTPSGRPGLRVRASATRRGSQNPRVSVRVTRRGRPVKGAKVAMADSQARTNAKGRASLRLALDVPGSFAAVARKGRLEGRSRYLALGRAPAGQRRRQPGAAPLGDLVHVADVRHVVRVRELGAPPRTSRRGSPGSEPRSWCAATAPARSRRSSGGRRGRSRRPRRARPAPRPPCWPRSRRRCPSSNRRSPGRRAPPPRRGQQPRSPRPSRRAPRRSARRARSGRARGAAAPRPRPPPRRCARPLRPKYSYAPSLVLRRARVARGRDHRTPPDGGGWPVRAWSRRSRQAWWR